MREPLPEDIKQSCMDFSKNLFAGGRTWKDITSYSRDVKERIPTTFQTIVGECHIFITCNHTIYQPLFIMNCHKLGITEKVLSYSEMTAEAAATAALSICWDHVKKLNEWFTL